MRPHLSLIAILLIVVVLLAGCAQEVNELDSVEVRE